MSDDAILMKLMVLAVEISRDELGVRHNREKLFFLIVKSFALITKWYKIIRERTTLYKLY